MSTVAKDSGGDFKQAPTGSISARCFQIIDLGIQRNEYEGQVLLKQQVLVSWELPLEDRLEDGRPMSISKFYTLSLNDKANLCIDLTSWRGRAFTQQEKEGFDVANLVGVPCMLSIVDNKGKSKVSGVMGLPKGVELPDQINESVVFDIDNYIAGDRSVFDNLTEGLQKLILKSEDLKAPANQPVQQHTNDGYVDDAFDDEIPF